MTHGSLDRGIRPLFFGRRSRDEVQTLILQLWSRWSCFVQKVSIFAEDGQNGKPVYSILLELDTGPNPSNHLRRTEAVRGLALDMEEKEIPVLARLAGRGVEILQERKTSKLDFESQEQEICAYVPRS